MTVSVSQFSAWRRARFFDGLTLTGPKALSRGLARARARSGIGRAAKPANEELPKIPLFVIPHARRYPPTGWPCEGLPGLLFNSSAIFMDTF